MSGIWMAYLITFGWALVGSVSMGLGIILASMIISLGIVVSAAIHP